MKTKTPQSAVSENLMRKISTADHIVYGKSLVLAAFYDIKSDRYIVGLFTADGARHAVVENEESLSAPEACKSTKVMEAVAELLVKLGVNHIDPEDKKDIVESLNKEQNSSAVESLNLDPSGPVVEEVK